jgi:hypothetical protein
MQFANVYWSNWSIDTDVQVPWCASRTWLSYPGHLRR